MPKEESERMHQVNSSMTSPQKWYMSYTKSLTTKYKHLVMSLRAFSEKFIIQTKAMFEDETETITEVESEDELPKLIAPQAEPRQFEILYPVALMFTYTHISALVGLYFSVTTATWKTLILNAFIFVFATVGVTAGAHRLWTHRAYKAKMPLQIILMVMYTFSLQYTLIDWIRNHRVHHRYSDTDGDPHNASRGFFFSHIGWLLVEKHPECKRRTRLIDMSDIYANPIITFQKKYRISFMGSVCLVIPTLICMYFFGETFNTAWYTSMLRFILSLHAISTVNSVAHLWGQKPYDKNIKPVQNFVISMWAAGEGFHNYHHTFPWDYRTAEIDNNWFNLSTKFIDFFAWIGWAYDLKTVPEDVIRSRASKTGDGTNSWGFKCHSKVA